MVFHLGADGSLAVLRIHVGYALCYERFALLELLAVVVADYVRQLCRLNARLNAQQVVESLIALRRLGCLVAGQHAYELCRQSVGVDHLALSISRVYADALDVYLCACRVEVLELQVAQVASVHSVCPLAPELLHVEVVSTHTYLLVGVEGDADVSVSHLLMVAQPAHSLYYLGYSRLVVSTKKRRSVGHYEVLADVTQQLGELLRSAHNARRQHYVASVVLLHNARLHVLTAAVGRRVVVRYESYYGYLTLNIRRQRGIDVPFLVHLHVLEPLIFELFFQEFSKNKLFRSTRHTLTLLRRLRVELHIVQKSFYNIHFII